MRPVVKRRNGITKGKPGGGMMKLIRLLLKKDGVGKRGGRVVTKNNTYRPNEMRNEQFTLQRRPLKRRIFQAIKPGMDDIFKIAKQLRKGNQDVVGDKCVKDDLGNLSFDNEAKKVAWKQHYERLLNEEFSWNPEDLTADPVVGPRIHIDVEMVVKAITKMKTGKAAGPSGIVAEMLKASGDTGARLVADLANDMVRNGVIPSDWEDSFIINIYKGKGDALERGNYRGLKLLDHVMKGIERVIEKSPGKESLSMTCNLVSCLAVVQLMQYSYSDSYKKNILLRTRNCTSYLLT